LELESLRLHHYRPVGSTDMKDITEEQREAHRTFHYVVTRWLQEMGADLRR